MASPYTRPIAPSHLVPAALAADATTDFLLGRVPITGVVSSVTIVPQSAITGADTNSATLAVVNKGQDGSGTTVIASKAFTSGVNAAAFDETALTVSATAADLNVTAGDILAFRRTKVGTGLATPVLGGIVNVTAS